MGRDGSPVEGAKRPESRVRDHLANERTFLAWVRTALGLIGVGFVLARMGVFLRQLPMGAGALPRPEVRGSREFLVTGMIFLLFGTAICVGSGWLYHRSREAIEEGRYEPARHAASILSVAVALGSLVITGLVLWQLLA